jgi:hypothetical protein
MSSEMTKNRPNCCATAVSARPHGTLRTFVGFYPLCPVFASPRGQDLFAALRERGGASSIIVLATG